MAFMSQNTLSRRNDTYKRATTLRYFCLWSGQSGLTLAVCLAFAGHRVIGVDISPQLVASINGKTIGSDEPGVKERILSSLDHLVATMSVEEAVQKTCLSFIIVPTPSNTFGGFSLKICFGGLSLYW